MGRSAASQMLVLAFAVLGFATLPATPVTAQLLQADFDTGAITPYVVLDAISATRTPLFGGTLRIAVDPGGGKAATGGDVGTSYSDVLAVVDILDWTAGLGQVVSLSTQVTTGPAAFDGYVLRLAPDAGTIELIKVINTIAADASISAAVTLDPASTDYRLVFRRVGTLLEGELYDLKALPSPIATVSLSDPSGIPGFTVGRPVLSVGESITTPAGSDVTIDNLVFVDFTPAMTVDTDVDEYHDAEDLCLFAANGVNQLSLQVDSDLDGFGNACDSDFDNSLSTTPADFAEMLGSMGMLVTGTELEKDLDGDRAVTVGDFAIYFRYFGLAPGP